MAQIVWPKDDLFLESPLQIWPELAREITRKTNERVHPLLKRITRPLLEKVCHDVNSTNPDSSGLTLVTRVRHAPRLSAMVTRIDPKHGEVTVSFSLPFHGEHRLQEQAIKMVHERIVGRKHRWFFSNSRLNCFFIHLYLRDSSAPLCAPVLHPDLYGAGKHAFALKKEIDEYEAKEKAKLEKLGRACVMALNANGIYLVRDEANPPRK